MKKKLIILAMMAAFSFIALPVGGSEANAQRRWHGERLRYSRPYVRYRSYNNYRWPNRHYYRSYRGYRNYGQYPRPYVGNRRHRYVPRYYRSSGYRRDRYVRHY